MTSKNGAKPAKSSEAEIARTYNAFKEFEGKRYTGMKVGRSHKWYYDQGEWKETKITPDQWEIHYSVTKRRAGHAPEGSGVPVGTGYHWYILAHQEVTKLDANDYSTSMVGMKFKLAHKRADTDKWSASEQAQRRNLIKILSGVIRDLEQQQDEKPASTPAPRERPLAVKVSKPRSRTNGRPKATRPRANGKARQKHAA